MNSKLVSRRHKTSTLLVSKQTLEQAIREGNAMAEKLMVANPQDTRLDQIDEIVSYLSSLLTKSPNQMQQEGASTLEDYLDDAKMPEIAQKIKQDVDSILAMRGTMKEKPMPQQNNQEVGYVPDNAVSTMASAGNDNFVTDRDDKGNPKAPEQVEVPRVATKKAAPAAAAPVVPPPAAPVAPPVAAPAPVAKADISELSSAALAAAIKALTGIKEFESDKSAQAFIEQMAEELKNRPVEVEPAKQASKLGGLNVADGIEVTTRIASAPEGWGGTVDEMKKVKEIDNPYALSWWMKDKGYSSHKGSELLKVRGGKALVAAMNRDLQSRFATSAQGGMAWVTDQDTATLVEDGGRTPEIAEAHAMRDDNTGIKRPTTEKPSKFASEMNPGKALKLSDKISEDLKKMYLEAKPLTEANDTRPVREAVESIYRAYDLMGEASKTLNKQQMQVEAEEEAMKIKEKNKKSSSLLGLAVAASEE